MRVNDQFILRTIAGDNLLGKQVGSATLTESGNKLSRCVFTASEIAKEAPAGYHSLWFAPVLVAYGDSTTIIVSAI